MALGMSAADVAVSAKGISELKSTISTRIKNARKVTDISGDEFKSLEKTIRTYWAGADCENFINDLKKAVKTLDNNISSYNSILSKSLDNYQSGFKSMQNNTYKSGTVKL